MTNYNDIPWDDIPTGSYIPNSIVRAEWQTLEDTVSSKGTRMFKATYQIQEPEEFFGRMHTENYVVGSKEDPQAFNRTSLGTIGLQRARIAAKIPPMGAQEICDHVEVNRPNLMLQLKEPKKDSDFQNNSIVNYFKVGERKAELLENTVKQQKPVSRPPVKPPAKPATANVPAEPQQQPQQTQQAPPATPKQTANAGMQIPMLDCPKCGQKVPAVEIAQHMMSCQG